MVIETGGWTAYDKLAGALALVLMSGYYVTPVQHVVAVSFNVLLSPLATLLPFSVFLIGLSGVTGVSSTVFQMLLRDSERVEELQQQLKEVQEQLKSSAESNSNGSELNANQQELMENWMAMMKLQFRPMVWSMLITVPSFLWLRWAVATPAVAAIPVTLSVPVLGQMVVSATLVGPIKVWLAWYIGGSISSSLLSRRLLTHITG